MRTPGRHFEALEGRLLLAGDVVLEWNQVALEAVKKDYDLGTTPEQPGPGGTARALAIVHVAMYDAVMAFDRHHLPYLHDYHAAAGASLDAAVAQAAHDTLASLFPRQRASIDAALATSMADVPAAARSAGVALGQEIAADCLTSREGDGAVDDMSFTPGTQPGEWRPDPLHPTQIAWGPNWGQVKPFEIESAADYAMPSVPDMTSQAYTDAFNEVKTLGGNGTTTTTTRTADQTEIAIFWGYDGTPGLGTPPRIYNQATRVIAEQQGNTVAENARLFAMVNVALADAAVASWDTKYIENFWRPVTAIRESDPGTGPTGLGDGNADTIGDPNWTPLGAPNDNGGGTNFTPPFPAYTSGHATFGGAAFGAIREFYGTDDIAFTLPSDEFNGVTRDQNGQVRPVRTRHYDKLSEAIEENGISRIYLGIHWRFDMEEGIKQGEAIARYVAGRFAMPTPTAKMFIASGMTQPAGTATSLAAAAAEPDPPAESLAATSVADQARAADEFDPPAEPAATPAAADEALAGEEPGSADDAVAEGAVAALAEEPAAAPSAAEPPAAPENVSPSTPSTADALNAVAFASALSAADDFDPQEMAVNFLLASRRR
jgi:hypothetical protein